MKQQPVWYVNKILQAMYEHIFKTRTCSRRRHEHSWKLYIRNSCIDTRSKNVSHHWKNRSHLLHGLTRIHNGCETSTTISKIIIEALSSEIKHHLGVEINQPKNAPEGSSAEMSQKLNDRANFWQESYKEKSALQNQDLKNILSQISEYVKIMTHKRYKLFI